MRGAKKKSDAKIEREAQKNKTRRKNPICNANKPNPMQKQKNELKTKKTAKYLPYAAYLAV
ncbi:hypothetical protein [Cytobacillus horneckiae]|uniref:hypothetical protein n=1 Tax=Cytobacillus horneckiae TaxID=549687 RepID=UPI0034CE02F3